MVDVNAFEVKQNFPIAGIADLIANRSYKEAQMRAQQQQELVEGLKTFGAGVDSLVTRRMQMAQALAQAHMYAGTPEGQALMKPTVSRTQQSVPLMPSQTAQGTDAQGNVLQAPIPNDAGTSPISMRPDVTTTSTPSPVDINTMATAFRNEQPGTFLSNLQAQQTNKRAYDLESQKETNAQIIAQKRLDTMKEIFSGNMGFKNKELDQRDVEANKRELASLKSDQDNLIKQFPQTKSSLAQAGTFGMYKGSQAEQNAQAQFAKNSARIRELESGNSSGSSHPALEGMTPAQKLALYQSLSE